MSKIPSHTLQILLLLLAFAPTLASCSKTKTSISQSYRNPGYEQTTFEKLLVIGVSPDQEGRKAFEDAFVKAIAARGGAAVASWGLLPDDTQLSEESIRGAIEGGDFDGVLITHLLSVDKDTQYVPGSTYNHPRTTYYGRGYGYGGGYYGYYGTTYAQVHDPGYFKTHTTFRLETSLYSVANSGLVWTAQSETVDPASLPDARASITAAVAEKLRAENLIP